MDEFYQSLIGKHVVALDISEDEISLRFRCADGNIVWTTEGDCCSTSWWADGYDLDALRDAIILDVKELVLEDPGQDGRNRQEEDRLYGYCIGTSKGATYLAFRNSSNGYYGGWAMLGEDSENENWRSLDVNDYSA